METLAKQGPRAGRSDSEYGHWVFLFPPQLLLARSRVGGGVRRTRNEDILDHAITVSYGTELKVTNVFETA